MEHTLFYVTAALGISIVVNIFLKRLGISQIIGYIFTGTIMVYAFDLRTLNDTAILEHIGEFGIVFLMFTIGLEISLRKMYSMRKEIFFNGILQVLITAGIVYVPAHYIFGIAQTSSMIIALAFALSSTAVVLSYLKSSKEIYSDYGQRATGILIFQDIAVIPILILIGFLTMSGEEKSIYEVLTHTLLSAAIVLSILFVVGKRLMTWLLRFSASSGIEELFMGSVLFIVVSASLLASYMGFTYSLGAFVAGMIIAETRYHHKVESDIAPFKDLLLGTFFVVVGMKIDIALFFDNIGLIVMLFTLVLVFKTLILYGVMRLTSSHTVSLQTALALSQIGEFSFVIFAVASVGGVLDNTLSSLLVLVVIFSMVITPFFIAKLNTIVGFFSTTAENTQTSDMTALETRKNHVIVCGYSIVGKFVATHLQDLGASFIVIDNSPKHVQEALSKGFEAYLGDASKVSILKALHIENAASVIVTLDNIEKKRLVCEAVAQYNQNVNLVVKISSLEEKKKLQGLPITYMVDSKREVAKVLVDRIVSCKLRI
ncbi:MAG: cation:proton antiporter [Sulfurimonadaceae bacterium]|jgi:CPA2 family monovalent cation:H+ antiporter-2|nr:cation:proton antiporter [Sulfurimonadaceae bacterium]